MLTEIMRKSGLKGRGKLYQPAKELDKVVAKYYTGLITLAELGDEVATIYYRHFQASITEKTSAAWKELMAS